MTTTVKRTRNADNHGLRIFRAFLKESERFGFVVPGHESLSRCLIVSATMGDDVAVSALRDLFLEHGKEAHADRLDYAVGCWRKTPPTWTDATRATFLRHCRKHGIYRRQ